MAEIGAFYRQILAGVTEKGLTLDEALEECRKSGIKWADVAARFFKEEDPCVIKERLNAHGLGVISVHTVLHAEDETKKSFDDMIELGRVDIDLAKKAGSKFLMIVPHMAKSFPEDKYAEFVVGARRVIAELTAYAKEMGIQATVENFSRRNVPYSSFDDIDWLLKNIPDLRFTLDSGNFTLSGFNELVGAKIFRDKAVYSHVKDIKEVDYETDCLRDEIYYARYALGEGQVRNADIIKDYIKHGYDGVFCIEYSGKNAFDTTLLSAKYLQNVLDKCARE